MKRNGASKALKSDRWLTQLDRRESGPSLGSLLVAFVITFTVAGSFVLGIAAAYTSVIALLHAFARRNRKPSPSLVLVTSDNHVGGD